MKENTFSLVIPTYNRMGKLLQLLESLEKQKYLKDKYEIIVSDDGSTEMKPYGILKGTIYIENKHQGVIKTVNAGLHKARNDIVIMMCDDILLHRSFLRAYNLWFNRYPNAQAITALQVPDPELVRTNIFARHEYAVSLLGFAKGLASSPIAVRREALERIGYLDNLEGMSEDTRMTERLIENGCMPIQSGIKVIHQQDYTLRGFIKSAINRGRAGREFKPRSFFVLKLLATPMMFFVYAYRYVKPEEDDANPSVVILHTIYNFILSLSGIMR